MAHKHALRCQLLTYKELSSSHSDICHNKKSEDIIFTGKVFPLEARCGPECG